MKIKFEFLLISFSILLTACSSSQKSTVETSLSEIKQNIAIVQPADGAVVDLAPKSINIQVQQPGGGVKGIQLRANGDLVESIKPDPVGEKIEAAIEWKPKAGGKFLLQAIAQDSTGKDFLSKVISVCVQGNDRTDCLTPENKVEPPVLPTGEPQIQASPENLKIGAYCPAAEASIHFEGYAGEPPDITDVKITGKLVNDVGKNLEFNFPLKPTGQGFFAGDYRLNTDQMMFLSDGNGKITYSYDLIKSNKEKTTITGLNTISIENCYVEGKGTVKISAKPNPVHFGNCIRNEVTDITFSARSNIDPSIVKKAVLEYIWFDSEGEWTGEEGIYENHLSMTPDSNGYIYKMDMNAMPEKMSEGGIIRYRAILFNSNDEVMGVSNILENHIHNCSVALATQETAPYSIPTIIGSDLINIAEIGEPAIWITKTPVPSTPTPLPTSANVQPIRMKVSVQYDSDGDGKCDKPWTFGGLSVSFAGKTSDVNSEGEYVIENIFPGNYTIKLNHPGYTAIGYDWTGITFLNIDYVVEVLPMGFCLKAP